MPLSIKKILILLSLFFSFESYSQTLKDEYNECAIEKHNMQDYQGAIEYFGRIIELYPNDSMAYFDRGMAYDLLKDYNNAIKDFTQHIRIDSSSVDGYFLRGIAKYHIKKYREAIGDFNKTVQLEASNADVYYYRAMAKFEQQDLAGADIDYKKAIELNPRIAKYYFSRAELMTKLGKTEKACLDVEMYKKLGGENNTDAISKLCH